MKHLKTYENINLKKYLVWKFTISYGIFEVLQNDGESILIKRLYIYVNNLIKSESFGSEVKEVVTIKIANEKVVYQSDNLEDCIKMMPIITQTNKYNL